MRWNTIWWSESMLQVLCILISAFWCSMWFHILWLLGLKNVLNPEQIHFQLCEEKIRVKLTGSCVYLSSFQKLPSYSAWEKWAAAPLIFAKSGLFSFIPVLPPSTAASCPHSAMEEAVNWLRAQLKTDGQAGTLIMAGVQCQSGLHALNLLLVPPVESLLLVGTANVNSSLCSDSHFGFGVILGSSANFVGW